MTCEGMETLLHALFDGELDAVNAREIETHVSSCSQCATQLRELRGMREAMGGPEMRYRAPATLHQRIACAPPAALPVTARAQQPRRSQALRGFAAGSTASAALAACFLLFVVPKQEEQRIVGDAVSAHLRSLQGAHLIDVRSTDQHTVKPWFNGRIDVAPPVIDLTEQGFRLVGGRVDYVNGAPVAAIVYERDAHVINLFVSSTTGPRGRAGMERREGLSVWHWAWSDLGYWAVSDVNSAELQEFGNKLEAAVKSSIR
jgi:anti-sigma factor RsiW